MTTRAALDPMFPPEVENARQPSQYLDAINAAKAADMQPWQIWNRLAFQPDAATLRAIGWNDAEISSAITACSLFNFYNRWVSSSGDTK